MFTKGGKATKEFGGSLLAGFLRLLIGCTALMISAGRRSLQRC